MNQYQTNLFSNLMHLCDSTDAFYFADQTYLNQTYRIFNYRLATYSHFQLPDALECRGIMFRIDETGEPLAIASHPQIKFFNLGENPMTMDLVITDSTIRRIELKEDGSLISTFTYSDAGHVELGVKSKGSLHSEQVRMTYEYLERNRALKDELLQLSKRGYTINMELTSPDNRIVLNYDETKLVVLNIRSNTDGTHLQRRELVDTDFPLIANHWVPEAWHLGYDTGAMLVSRSPSIVGIEGFIVYLNNGTVFKLKTDWYLVQHRAKDSIDSPRRLFETAINDATDDLRSLFTDNQQILDKITEMEEFASNLYNRTVATVEKFVGENIELIKSGDRKSFAIKGQEQLDSKIFGLVMQKYQCIANGTPDKDVDYKAFCLKHWREWGLTDSTPEV